MLALWLIIALISYPKELTEQDQNNIGFIIKTLSGKSLISLYFYQDQLKEVGEKTRGVDPVLYLGYIYGTPELEKAVPSIATVAWKRFVKDFSKSLQRAKEGGAITDATIEAFSKKTGRPVDALKPYFVEGNWQGLFAYLDSTIPKK